MDSVKITKVSPADVELLRKIGSTTFAETFASHNSAENMAAYLEEHFSSEKMKAQINDPNSVFYFALFNDAVIGYLKVNFGQSQTELKDAKALEIERIYVLQEYQGKKVGQLLYEKAIAVATQKDANYVWLGVWDQNKKAIRFYNKNGFIEFDKHIFRLGEDQQTDIMMKLRLK